MTSASLRPRGSSHSPLEWYVQSLFRYSRLHHTAPPPLQMRIRAALLTPMEEIALQLGISASNQMNDIVQRRNHRREARVVEERVRLRGREQISHFPAVLRQHVHDFRGEIDITGSEVKIGVLEARSHVEHALETGVIRSEIECFLLESGVNQHIGMRCVACRISSGSKQLHHTASELVVGPITRHYVAK